MKKLFIGSCFFLIIVLILLLAYNFAFKGNDKIEPKVSLEENRIESPEEENRIKAITQEPVTGIFLDKIKEKIFFYSLANGKLWQIGLEGGQVENISNVDVIGLQDALWSVDGSKTISIISQSDNQKGFLFWDRNNNKKINLKNGVDEVAWDNLGTKIIYKYFEKNDNSKSVNVANPDGSSWKKIADTSFRNVAIEQIPQTSLVSFWNKGKSEEETNLMVAGMNGGELQKVFSGKFGADYKWSPDGKRAIISHLKDGSKKDLATGLVDREGFYKELGIPTMVSKMEWSLDNRHIYYALPAIPEGFNLPDDYKTKKFNTVDTFWKINIETGEKTRLIELADIDGIYDVYKPFLSPSEDAFFFINRVDEKIYRLKL